jgi:hypothetical protein
MGEGTMQSPVDPLQDLRKALDALEGGIIPGVWGESMEQRPPFWTIYRKDFLAAAAAFTATLAEVAALREAVYRARVLVHQLRAALASEEWIANDADLKQLLDTLLLPKEGV